MSAWGQAQYFPMKTAPQNTKGVPHSDQRGVKKNEKRCTACKHVKSVKEFPPGRGFKNRRAQCRECDNRRRRGSRDRHRAKANAAWRSQQEKLNRYDILFDPSGTYIGWIRGYDFKETLRWGWWPQDMIVEHHGKMYIIKGRRLHEHHTRPTKIRSL